MKGKIFPESNNIFQDQAKILFNYYQQMAEKIVQEEERIEKEIAKLEEEKAVLNIKSKQSPLTTPITKMCDGLFMLLYICTISHSYQLSN